MEWNDVAFAHAVLLQQLGVPLDTARQVTQPDGSVAYMHTLKLDGPLDMWAEAIAAELNESLPLLRTTGVRLITAQSPDMIYLTPDTYNKLRWWRFGNAHRRARLSTQIRRHRETRRTRR